MPQLAEQVKAVSLLGQLFPKTVKTQQQTQVLAEAVEVALALAIQTQVIVAQAALE